jgi:uncharacterized protein
MRRCAGCSLLSVIAVVLVLGCSRTRADRPYTEQVTADRAAKDQAFLQSPESPVPPDKRSVLLPLAYYAVDESFRVPAALSPSQGEPAIEMPTSTGKRRAMRRAGTLRFTVNGEARTLTAFVEASDSTMTRLFIPFADATNGAETYAAGRYLDLDRTVTGLYDLDFNRAYQPYCSYNPEYDCPFPPRENRLELAVRAGERLKSPGAVGTGGGAGP